LLTEKITLPHPCPLPSRGGEGSVFMRGDGRSQFMRVYEIITLQEKKLNAVSSSYNL
jgi:hypothetical protein